MISVVIATTDRDIRIGKTIHSIQKNRGVSYEIIVVDQSSNQNTEAYIHHLPYHNVIYRHIAKKNKSNALNEGIQIARGEIIAFTDDDCTVSPNWLQEIQQTLKHHPAVGGVVGTTKPYLPSVHTQTTCVSIIEHKHNKIITRPIHHIHIGYGNNMAWRAGILRLHGFSTNLGMGSPGKNAEDAYFMLQQLLAGIPMYINKHMTVYHDHWLSKQELLQQNYMYIFAEMVCYSQFALSGWKFAQRVLQKNWSETKEGMCHIMGDIVKRHIWRPSKWNAVMVLSCARLCGYVRGWIWYQTTNHKDTRRHI